MRTSPTVITSGLKKLLQIAIIAADNTRDSSKKPFSERDEYFYTYCRICTIVLSLRGWVRNRDKFCSWYDRRLVRKYCKNWKIIIAKVTILLINFVRLYDKTFRKRMRHLILLPKWILSINTIVLINDITHIDKR